MKKLLFATLMLVLLCAGTAFADTVATYTFNASAWGSGPFGTVTATQTSPSVVHVDVNVSPNWFVETGNGNSHWVLTFQSSVAGLSMSNLSLSSSYGTFSLGSGTYSTSNFGAFNYAILCPDCRNGANSLGKTQEFSFDLTGLTLSGLLANDQGYYFTSDIYNAGNGLTGLVGATGDTPSVPEPGSLMLLGSGLLGAGGFLRRRFLK